MKILTTITEIQAYTAAVKKEGKTIGLCPTMGALHDGHMTLMDAARKRCDTVIASVFVNPVQFGPNEDYAAYPRTFADDCAKLEAHHVDAVFHPEVAALYPKGYSTYVNVEGDFTQILCGAKRPTHFRGVATVLVKLMNLSRADEAFFGQKDAQQVVVVKNFVKDLNLPVRINMVPIHREASGLAMSSRNKYLSSEEKDKAVVLYRSLQAAAKAYECGERRSRTLRQIASNVLQSEPSAVIDYVELYDFPSLQPVAELGQESILAIAVFIGSTRLIDNILLGGAR